MWRLPDRRELPARGNPHERCRARTKHTVTGKRCRRSVATRPMGDRGGGKPPTADDRGPREQPFTASPGNTEATVRNSAQWERSSNLRPYKHLLFLNRPILTNGALPPALKTLSVQPARGHCFSTISAAPVPSGRLPGRGRTGHRGRPTPASGLAVPAADGIARASCRIACCWWSSARCAGSARADRPAPSRRCWRGRRLPAGRADRQNEVAPLVHHSRHNVVALQS